MSEIQDQGLTEALTADRLSTEEAYSKLGAIYELLRDFQQSYPATYQYLCAQGQDVTLADAMSAIALCVEIFN